MCESAQTEHAICMSDADVDVVIVVPAAHISGEGHVHSSQRAAIYESSKPPIDDTDIRTQIRRSLRRYRKEDNQ